MSIVKPIETIRSEELADWNMNADFYRGDDRSPLMAELAMRRDRYYDIRAGQQVLDLGCGSGATVAYLRRHGVDAVGLDYAPAMVELARKEYGLEGFVQCSPAMDLPFRDNAFDVVVANGVFHHLAVQDELPAALKEIYRVLRPGGQLCCFDRNGSFVSGAMTHICVLLKSVLRVLARRHSLASCASRNEISFGGKHDLDRIKGHGFALARRKNVSTLPFFLAVVTLNATQYFISERVRRFLEPTARRPLTWIDSVCDWQWCSVEQFVVFQTRKRMSAQAAPGPAERPLATARAAVPA